MNFKKTAKISGLVAMTSALFSCDALFKPDPVLEQDVILTLKLPQNDQSILQFDVDLFYQMTQKSRAALVKKYGSDYVNKFLIPTVHQAVADEVQGLSAERIEKYRDIYDAVITKNLREHLEPAGIQVKYASLFDVSSDEATPAKQITREKMYFSKQAEKKAVEKIYE